MTSSLQSIVRALLALALLPLAGCGGGSDGAAPTTRVAAPVAARYLTASGLEHDLGNGFREGLYRLAVMSQPPDDAADLGQDLPTGALTQVRCAAAGPRGTCSVRWRTVGGAPRGTHYRVRLLAGGCFAAGATPRLPDHRDATIASFSEHPLNALVSVRKGC